MVLIAQLATAAGTRAPLAHTANQAFLALVKELKAQGLGNKVIADMFGLALCTYHHKVRRLTESSTFRGKSLWAAVLEFVQDHESVLRSEVLQRFNRDEETVVRSVLSDLVDSGLLYRTGRGDRTMFRAASEDDHPDKLDRAVERLGNLIWIAIHRFGPVDIERIRKVVPAEQTALQTALDKLVSEGRILRKEKADDVQYSCDDCLIPFGDSTGWEAAVWDHYQAMVTEICTKIRLGFTRADASDRIGGSTYSYDVWEGHLCYDEVAGFLSEVRQKAVAIRQRVESYNREHVALSNKQRFIAYVGQTVLDADGEGDSL